MHGNITGERNVMLPSIPRNTALLTRSDVCITPFVEARARKPRPRYATRNGGYTVLSKRLLLIDLANLVNWSSTGELYRGPFSERRGLRVLLPRYEFPRAGVPHVHQSITATSEKKLLVGTERQVVHALSKGGRGTRRTGR